MVTLPNDIIIDILTRLPANYLMRFKSVCKSWKTLISDPRFVRFHLHRQKSGSSSASGGHYLILKSKLSRDHIHRVNLENPGCCSSTVEFYHPKHSSLDSVYFAGSCNGLICLRTVTFRKTGSTITISFLNPLTINFFDLPIPEDVSRNCRGVGFGYDYTNDDYKVVSIIQVGASILLRPPDLNYPVEYFAVKFMVFSCKSNSWRRISNFSIGVDDDDFIISRRRFFHGAALLNDHLLHWILFTRKHCQNRVIIACLDLCSEEWTEIIGPIQQFHARKYFNLTVYNECLCLIDFISNHRSISGWVMKEYGVKESWVRFNYSISPSFDNFDYRKNAFKYTWIKKRRMPREFYKYQVCGGAEICLGSLVTVGDQHGVTVKKKEKKKNGISKGLFYLKGCFGS